MGLIWNIYTKISIGIAIIMALLFISAIPYVFEIGALLLGVIAGLVCAGVVQFYSHLNEATRNVYDTEHAPH